MIALRFTPIPRGTSVPVQALVNVQHCTFYADLQKDGYSAIPLTPLIQEGSWHFGIETEDLQTLKMDLERYELITAVEIIPITVPYKEPILPYGLCITIPLPIYRERWKNRTKSDS